MNVVNPADRAETVKRYWEYHKQEELRRNYRKRYASLHYKRLRDHCCSI